MNATHDTIEMTVTTLYVVQSRHHGAWIDELNGECFGAEEAEEARQSLIALGEDWTEESTRVVERAVK